MNEKQKYIDKGISEDKIIIVDKPRGIYEGKEYVVLLHRWLTPIDLKQIQESEKIIVYPTQGFEDRDGEIWPYYRFDYYPNCYEVRIETGEIKKC